MAYWQLYYHFIWTTKNRQPLITPSVEPIIFSFITKKAIGLGGIVHALNGIEDHTHLVVAVPPSISLSNFIGQVKGVSSAKLNQMNLLPHLFYWQSDYTVFSIDQTRLSQVVSYVEKQKLHHKKNELTVAWELPNLNQ